MLDWIRNSVRKPAVVVRQVKNAGRALGWRRWRRGGSLVLVVDDDPDVAPLVSAALGPFDIASDDVSDGASALARLRNGRYGLVILDLAMEGLNGFDVLLALKTEAGLRNLPVIVLTADASDQSLARSFGYGADDFLIKPFRTTELGMRAYRLLYPLAA